MEEQIFSILIFGKYWFTVFQGALHVPKMPQVKGLEEFGGKAMHTARWVAGEQ